MIIKQTYVASAVAHSKENLLAPGQLIEQLESHLIETICQP